MSFKSINDKLKHMDQIRFIEIEAADLYYSSIYNKPIEIKNSEYEFNEKYSDIVPPNLDLYYLESKNKLTLKKLGQECYSDVFVNVSFKYPLFINAKKEQVHSNKEYKTTVSIQEIRKHLYLNGFVLNGKEYVRYKRSSGAAKTGSCLFIKKELFPMMAKWSKTGLDEAKDLCFEDLTSYEAYKSLSLSSIITTLDLNPYNILFVKDAKVTLKKQNVIKIYHDKKCGLNAEESICDVTNNIFDGEGLLDVSVFNKINKQNKGMMLLRSRFFKCCAFNTNLKKWFEDNNITRIDQLNGITFAKSIDDIVLVASESCLKYLKMCNGGFSKENIKRWCDEINNDKTKFGVVKTDKPTRFFDGEMVETTYQLLNSLQLKQNNVRNFIQYYFEYIEYIRDIKNTPEFIRFFLEGEDKGNQNDDYDDDSEYSDDIDFEKMFLNYSSYSFKNKICLELIKIDERIKYTNLFKKHIFNSVVDSLLLKIYNGRVLVNGTYATLFGNPYEYLKYVIKEFDPECPTSLLNDGEIYCQFFENGKKIVGSRAPHITMGNVLLVENKELKEINQYFNLTKEIVVVDAINNNIQHRLSGCDYDSDSMLLTDNDILVAAAEKNYNLFPVPFADFQSEKKPLKNLDSCNKKTNLILNLYDIDNKIANNNVGKIVNLSQLLNSYLWDNFGNGKNKSYKELYNKIAILSVLSGAEIDSAKRSFPFNTTTEYNRILKYANKNGFKKPKPLFFVALTKKNGHKPKIGDIKKGSNKNRKFKTTMDFLWAAANENKFNSKIRTNTISFFDLICEGFNTNSIPGPVYNQVNKAIKVLEDTSEAVDKISNQMNNNDFELKKMNFNNEIKKAYFELKRKINTPEKTKLVIKRLEEREDGYSKSFIFLYIITSFSYALGYTLRELFSEDAKALPTLRKTAPGEKPQYTLFNKFNYNRKD